MLWNGTPKFDYKKIKRVDSPMVGSMILMMKNYHR